MHITSLFTTHRELGVREAWIGQRIRAASYAGDLSRHDARRALDQLNAIRQNEAGLRRDDGRLRTTTRPCCRLALTG